jgi:hypothetical protein
MDYTDPTDRRLRDEPTLPLSKDEVQIAVANYHAETLKQLFSFLNTPTPTNHEKETPRADLN